MYSMHVVLALGRSGGFIELLRFLALGILLVLVPLRSAEGATLVYTPVDIDTEVWDYTYPSGWNSIAYDGLFLAGSRETTVAQAFFELPPFDWESVVSVTYRISIPNTFNIKSLTYLKVYGATGDPTLPYPGAPHPDRNLLYFNQGFTATNPSLELDLTSALRKAGTMPDKSGLFRVDLTAYTPEWQVLPFTNPELIVKTVPEPSASIIFLCALAILMSVRRRVARACRR